jgi:hypothetical protein
MSGPPAIVTPPADDRLKTATPLKPLRNIDSVK